MIIFNNRFIDIIHVFEVYNLMVFSTFGIEQPQLQSIIEHFHHF